MTPERAATKWPRPLAPGSRLLEGMATKGPAIDECFSSDTSWKSYADRAVVAQEATEKTEIRTFSVSLFSSVLLSNFISQQERRCKAIPRKHAKAVHFLRTISQ